jgi:hypothetical protein
MPKTPPLHRTSTARLFEYISCFIWQSLGDRHRLSLTWNETSITDEILYKIAEAADQFDDIKVELYKSFKEYQYGHDLDLFVEVFTGHFLWFALQAKVMNCPSEKYNSILERKVKNGTVHRDYQWRLLRKGQKANLWLPFYLFYNGFDDKKSRDKRMYGCSVVSVDDFIQISCDVHEQPLISPNGQLIVPTYGTFHHNNIARPWHHLIEYAEWYYTNSGGEQKGSKLYTLEESRFHTRYGLLKEGVATTQFITTTSPPSVDTLNHNIGQRVSAEDEEQANAPYRIIIRHSETDRIRARLHKVDLHDSLDDSISFGR